MSREQRLAKIKRDLVEVRARILRIQGEAFGLEQQFRDLEMSFAALAAEGRE